VTTTVTGTGAAVRPMVDRATAMRLAAAEYQRITEELRELSARDWAAATCCPGWDVRLMTCHVLGMAEFAASPAEQARQALRARRADGAQFIDRLTAVQVAKHAHQSTADLTGLMAVAGPRAVRGRRRSPALLRRVSLAQSADPAGTRPERWTYGFLTDVIGTRDTWMHRSDIAAATGRPMALTADHDGIIVADVVREWAERHGQPCSLTLAGPAGGAWTWGQDGPGYQLDAIQFCRILSGRGYGHGLLATAVPF